MHDRSYEDFMSSLGLRDYIPFFLSTSISLLLVRIERSQAARKLDLDRVHVLPNSSIIPVCLLTTLVHLLWVHAVLRVQVLDLSVWENAVVAAVQLELRSQLTQESVALLLTSKLEEVRALPHDRGTTSWHLKDLLLFAIPSNHVKLLHLSLAQKTAGAASEYWGRHRWIECGLDPRLLLLLRFLLWCWLLGRNALRGNSDNSLFVVASHSQHTHKRRGKE